MLYAFELPNITYYIRHQTPYIFTYIYVLYSLYLYMERAHIGYACCLIYIIKICLNCFYFYYLRLKLKDYSFTWEITTKWWKSMGDFSYMISKDNINQILHSICLGKGHSRCINFFIGNINLNLTQSIFEWSLSIIEGSWLYSSWNNI